MRSQVKLIATELPRAPWANASSPKFAVSDSKKESVWHPDLIKMARNVTPIKELALMVCANL